MRRQTQIDTVDDGRYRQRPSCVPSRTFAWQAKPNSAQPPRIVGASPEAIEKRRVARLFNDILGGRGLGTHKRDGRTEKRRQRLMSELESGKMRASRDRRPLDVLQHVNELMHLGEPLGSIRKVAKARKGAVAAEAIVEVVTRLQRAYGFRAECYRFVVVLGRRVASAGVQTGESTPKGARAQARRVR